MGGVVKAVLSPITAVADAVFDKPKLPEAPIQRLPPQPVRRDESALRQELFSREGTRSNRRTGSGGTEARGGTKTKLGA